VTEIHLAKDTVEPATRPAGRSSRYQSQSTRLSLRPGATESRQWSLGRTHGWYDLVVAVRGGTFQYHYAGHLENGEDSISDPALGGLL
jgi:phospholipase C